MLSETSHESTHTTQFYLYEVPRMVKFIETKSRLVVARVWGEGEILNGHGVLI